MNLLLRDRHVMPWRIEDELRALGANFVQAGLWRSHAVRDGNLVTGQQNFSSAHRGTDRGGARSLTSPNDGGRPSGTPAARGTTSVRAARAAVRPTASVRGSARTASSSSLPPFSSTFVRNERAVAGSKMPCSGRPRTRRRRAPRPTRSCSSRSSSRPRTRAGSTCPVARHDRGRQAAAVIASRSNAVTSRRADRRRQRVPLHVEQARGEVLGRGEALVEAAGRLELLEHRRRDHLAGLVVLRERLQHLALVRPVLHDLRGQLDEVLRRRARRLRNAPATASSAARARTRGRASRSPPRTAAQGRRPRAREVAHVDDDRADGLAAAHARAAVRARPRAAALARRGVVAVEDREVFALSFFTSNARTSGGRRAGPCAR